VLAWPPEVAAGRLGLRGLGASSRWPSLGGPSPPAFGSGPARGASVLVGPGGTSAELSQVSSWRSLAALQLAARELLACLPRPTQSRRAAGTFSSLPANLELASLLLGSTLLLDVSAFGAARRQALARLLFRLASTGKFSTLLRFVHPLGLLDRSTLAADCRRATSWNVKNLETSEFFGRILQNFAKICKNFSNSRLKFSPQLLVLVQRLVPVPVLVSTHSLTLTLSYCFALSLAVTRLPHSQVLCRSLSAAHCQPATVCKTQTSLAHDSPLARSLETGAKTRP